MKIILFECFVPVKVSCNMYDYFAELAVILLKVIIDIICKFYSFF